MGIKEKNNNKEIDPAKIGDKIRHFCAYQERCRQEVMQKLGKLGVYGKDMYSYLETLEDENFLDEDRYAKSYARGKFHGNHWGRFRIRRELRQRNIPELLVDAALEEISEQEYLHCLEKIIRSKMDASKEPKTIIRNHKVAAYAYRRGFEPELTWSIINAHFPSESS